MKTAKWLSKITKPLNILRKSLSLQEDSKKIFKSLFDTTANNNKHIRFKLVMKYKYFILIHLDVLIVNVGVILGKTSRSFL